MPQRIIYEQDCADDTLDALSAEEERLFWRLLTACDDYGLFDARPKVVRSNCWKLNPESVTPDTIQRSLEGMAAKGAVLLYTVDGQPFGRVLVWRGRPRSTRPKYPLPPGATTPEAEPQWNAPGDPAPLPPPTPTTPPQAEPAPPTPWRKSAEFTEYEDACRDGRMQGWTTEAALVQLSRRCETAHLDYGALIEIAREAALGARDKSPSVAYGLRIIDGLPPSLHTRADVAAHFAERRANQPRGQPGRSSGMAGWNALYQAALREEGAT